MGLQREIGMTIGKLTTKTNKVFNSLVYVKVLGTHAINWNYNGLRCGTGNRHTYNFNANTVSK